MFESDKRHDVWSCGSAAECTSLYGDAYTSVGGVINPPTPVGNIAATIQAPNLTVTSGGQIVNVGNVVGQSVSLTGTSLVNGITTANTYTPQVGNAPQVISLAPANGGLNLTIPASLGGAGSSILTGATGQQNGPSYVVGGLGATLDPVSPQVLLSNLPASLQPSTTTFYFSPQQEAIQLQQAALMQTGKASFINGLSTDSTSQLSVNDQQKLVMYGNAVEYAKTNNIQLGQALTPEQIAGLSQPMLWYVEQTVPEPGCAATGNAKCPTVTALMPQVYLPENFTALSAGGQILASNDLSLNFGSTATGGSILNTGSITSGGTLTVNTGALTNRANVVDVGEIWSYIKDAGYLKTTGTMVQPGGFMSAAAGGLTLNVDQFNQIGGALQLLDPNGQVDQAATQAFIAGVAAQLGDNFVQQTLQNDLHTDFVKQGGNFGIQQVGMIMAAAMTGAALGPLFSGMIAAQLGTTAATFVAGGLGNVMASAALTAMASSTLTQVMFTGSLDFGSVLKTGLSAAITAGLLDGITYSAKDGFDFASKVSDNSLSRLAGVKPTFVDGAVSQAGATTAGQWFTQGVAILGQSVIQAGVQSTIQGGSFLDALKVSGVSNLSAALAYQIGSLGAETLGQTGYVGAHAVLGCAAGAAVGSGCAGGAIGAGVSALVADDIARAVTNGKGVTDPAQLAIIASATQLLSAVIAGAVGANPNAAARAAQNETLNNACAPGHECGTFTSALKDTVRATANAGLGIAEAVPNLVGGALPGFPDYVPFLDKYKLAYDDPDFGELTSFLLSLGIAKAAGKPVANEASEATRPASAANTAAGTANSVSGARLSMQLSAEQSAGTRAPTSISSYSDHAIQQIAGRDGGIGVSRAAVNDAFANPTAIQYVPSKYGPTFKYVGQNATVVVNSQGNVVTAWGTSAAGVRK
ncbi:DUF637 domain-containing protein [Pandoraea commovens]